MTLVFVTLFTAPLSHASGLPLDKTPSPDLAREATEPIASELVEKENVRLIVLDVLVLDSKDRTVPDLTLDDFGIVIDGKPVTPDTLDVRCDEVMNDPKGVNHAEERGGSAPEGSGGKIVLAFDYLHLQRKQRVEALDRAKEMVRYGEVEGEEIMVAALNGGLRIEQTFNGDREQVRGSLQRMQHDITLWQPAFFHLNENSWVGGITALLDVLGTVPGPKKVVFFSTMGDVPLDIEFRQIAAQAATARCAFYPVDVRGLEAEPLDATGGDIDVFG